MRTKQIWMLIYTICFSVFVVFAIRNDVTNHESIWIILSATFVYLIATTGNLLYVLGDHNRLINKFWKVLSILVFGHFIITGMIDNYQHTTGILVNIQVWLINLLIHLPTFMANFILGYKMPSKGLSE